MEFKITIYIDNNSFFNFIECVYKRRTGKLFFIFQFRGKVHNTYL